MVATISHSSNNFGSGSRLAYGTDTGAVIVDIVHKVCLLNIATPDLYGGADPYQRVPKSPKRTQPPDSDPDRCRSPSIDQPEQRESSNSSPDVMSVKNNLGQHGRITEREKWRVVEQELDGAIGVPGNWWCAMLNGVSGGGGGCSGSPARQGRDVPRRSKSQGTRRLTKCLSTLSYSEPIPARHNLIGSRQYASFGSTVTSTFYLLIIPLFIAHLNVAPAMQMTPQRYDSTLKNEGGSFSRSRSSSMSSLENISSEAVQCIAFADSYTKKTGTMFRLKGSILTMSFLDCNGALIPYTFESWRDDTKDKQNSVCLICYVSNGHICAYSLPSLRSLIDADFLPLADLRIARTFSFSNHGHGLFLCSPTEIQKFTVSAEFCASLSEMVGELFLPHEMPEAPKESFFKGLFGGGSRSLDREEL
ncbi:unnamed protein product, partial [Nesidiocoris tenuis]